MLDAASPDRNGRTNLGSTQRFSFGVSRGEMKKVFVDEILLNPTNYPGPDKYDKNGTFGKKSGADRYSFRAKNDLWSVHLDKQKQFPGPG